MKNVAPVVALILGAFSIVAYAAFWLAVLPAHAGEPACGRASWYGPGFHGKPTASGETYNQNALTAAMPSRKYLGRHYRVTYQGRSVDVRINDVGPAKWTGRAIDLSKAAAAKLGMIRAGVGSVCLTRLR